MPVTAPVRHLTEAGYLDFERKAEVKYEFSVGGLFANIELQPASERPSGV